MQRCFREKGPEHLVVGSPGNGHGRSPGAGRDTGERLSLYWPNQYDEPQIAETGRSVGAILATAQRIIPGHRPPIVVDSDLLRRLLAGLPRTFLPDRCPEVAGQLHARLFWLAEIGRNASGSKPPRQLVSAAKCDAGPAFSRPPRNPVNRQRQVIPTRRFEFFKNLREWNLSYLRVFRRAWLSEPTQEQRRPKTKHGIPAGRCRD